MLLKEKIKLKKTVDSEGQILLGPCLDPLYVFKARSTRLSKVVRTGLGWADAYKHIPVRREDHHLQVIALGGR